MRRLLPLLLLCGCAGSLVDHSGVSLSNPDGGGQCAQQCTTDVAGATAYCGADNRCTYKCPDGQFKVAAGCRPATEISAGTSHACAVAGGEARCWGANDDFQLGHDVPAGTAHIPRAPTGLTGTVSHVAAGAAHSCAIADGNVYCWGANGSGQLGRGSSGASSMAVQQVAGISGAQLVAAGGAHTCAATATKTYCWGADDSGQVGDGATLPAAPRPAPVEVPQAAGATALVAGASHTCALTPSGVLCWGANDKGQLGTSGTGSPSATPIGAQGLSGAFFLAAGANHGCAVTGTDSLSCWGSNADAQIPGASGSTVNPPRSVFSGARSVAGGAAHTCAVTKDQSIRCWGLNDQKQLGSDSTGLNQVDVALTSVELVAAGFKHTCATADGTTLCWGLNDRGQLGASSADTGTSTAEPTPISGL